MRLTFLLLFLVLAACEEVVVDDQPPSPRLLEAEFPQRVLYDSTGSPLAFRVEVENPANSVSVHCQMSEPGPGTLAFALSDAGDSLFADSIAGLVPGETGDNVPGDGVFTRLLYAGRLDPGNYQWEIALFQEEQELESLTGEFQVALDSPPAISLLQAADTLVSGGSALFSFLIMDPDPQDVPVSAYLYDTTLVNVFYPLTALDDTTWFLQVDSTFGARRQGQVGLRAVVEDGLGLRDSTDFSLWVENTPPRQGELFYRQLLGFNGEDPIYENLPRNDTLHLEIPGEGDSFFEIQLQVSDSQGNADLASVVCEIWDRDPREYKFTLVFQNDGELPDETAGDEQWGAGFSISSSNQPDAYDFLIYALDYFNQSSDTLTTVVYFENSASGGGPPLEISPGVSLTRSYPPITAR